MQQKAKTKNQAAPAPTNTISSASLIFICLLWAAPALNPYHTNPLPDFYTEWISFAFGLLGMIFLMQTRIWRDGLWIPRIALAPFLLGMVLIGQVLLNRVAYTETVWLAELYLLWAAGLAWLGAALRKQLGLEVVLHWLSWAALTAGLISSLIGLLQHLHWHQIFGVFIAPYKEGPVYGNLGQANHYANCLSIALVGLGYLLAKQRIAKSWAIAIGVMLLLGMVLSGSRSTLIYLLLFVLAAHSLCWRSTGQPGRLLCRAALIAVPLYGVVQLAVMYLSPLLLQQGLDASGSYPNMGIAISSAASGSTAGERFANVGSALTSRLFLWQQAWHMFIDAPLLGMGWGEFIGQFFLRYSDIPNPGVPTIDPNAHNVVMHLLATTGILGALAVLAPLGLWAWRARGLPVSTEKWWLICILAVQGIHGSLEYNLWYAQFLGIAALLLGLGETSEFRFPEIRWKRMGWAWLAALIPASVLLAEAMRDYQTIEGWMRSGTPRDTFVRASSLQADWLDLRERSLFRPFAELLHPELIVSDSASSAEKLKLNQQIMRFAPNSEVVYRHAMMLAANGEQDAAIKQLERSIAVYPEKLGVFVQRIKILADSHPDTFEKILQVAQEKLNEISATHVK